MPIVPPALGQLLREVVLYVGASPASRWHQLDSLRDLDDHLLKDIGICRQTAARGQPRNPRTVAEWVRDVANGSTSGA